MPLSNSGGDELSLRHLPDVSDASFSFQIPLSAQDDNLLAEDDKDFFRGAYLSPVTSAPRTTTTTTKDEPLTLHHLTPRPRPRRRSEREAPQNVNVNVNVPSSFPTLSYPHQNDADQPVPKMTREEPPSRVKAAEAPNANGKGRSKPKPKLITPSIPHLPSMSIEGSPAGARLEAIKAEVDLLAKDELIQSSNPNPRQELDITGALLYQRPKGFRKTSLEKINPISREEKETRNRHGRTNQRVREGGITKTKTTEKNTAHIPAVEEPIFSLSHRPSLSKDLNGDGESVHDTSVGSLNESEGAAARLVQYSQKLINPFGALKPDGHANLIVSSEPVQASTTWDSATGTHTHPSAQAAATTDDSDKPLTLSQLSPRKNSRCCSPSSEALTPPASVPMLSPLRPSSKRPVSVADEGQQQWKKIRTDASTVAVELAGNRNSEMKSKPKQQQRHASSSASSASSSSQKHPKSDAARSGPSRPATRPIDRGITKAKQVKELGKGSTITRRAPAFKPGSVDVNGIDDSDDAPVRHAPAAAASSKAALASTSTSRSSASGTSHLRSSRQRTDDRTIAPPGNSLSLKGKSYSSTASSSVGGGGGVASALVKPAFHIPAISLHATRPVEFNLRTSSRSESRIKGQGAKEEPSDASSQSQSQSQQSRPQREKKQQQQQHHHHDIPDFKALHAAQEAKLALLRKENVQPTVPLPMKWETEQRVRERQKFDELVREKELELGRLREEERRRREEEEEREVRELRRRAVIKAHEVPEWYKEAPKKKDKLVG